MRPLRLPRESFRIRPSARSRRFFVVHIADDLEKMAREMRRCGIEPHDDQLGMCVSASTTDRGWLGLLGVVFLSRQVIGVGLVTHELAHAAFRVADRRRLRVEHWERGVDYADGTTLTNPAEETYCLIVEHLTRDFWRQWYRNGYDRK